MHIARKPGAKTGSGQSFLDFSDALGGYGTPCLRPRRVGIPHIAILLYYLSCFIAMRPVPPGGLVAQERGIMTNDNYSFTEPKNMKLFPYRGLIIDNYLKKSYLLLVTVFVPRRIPILPVRISSLIPNWRSSFSIASILPVSPAI